MLLVPLMQDPNIEVAQARFKRGHAEQSDFLFVPALVRSCATGG